MTVKNLLAITLAGCGVSSGSQGPDEIDPPETTNAPAVGAHLGATAEPGIPRRPIGYRVERLPSPMSPGRSYAARLICGTSTVVGQADITTYGASHPVTYANGQLTDLGTLGGQVGTSNAGNAAGTVVGQSAAPTNGRAFVYRNGAMTQLPGLGGAFSAAYGINDSEQIVGYSSIAGTGNTDQHAILWQPGATTPVDLTALNGGRAGYARDINNRGDIAGIDADPATGHTRAVVWRNRVLVELDDDGASDSQALAINESGTITGYTKGTGNTHAVVWENGVMTDLSTLAGAYSHAMGIDNGGDVVGDATTLSTDNPQPYAALFTGDAPVNLNDYVDQTHWWLSVATDVCDDGRIVGSGTLDGVWVGFLLVPQY